MTSSSPKSDLDLQIAARNRWAHRSYVRPGEVAEARGAAHGVRDRGLAAAATVALTGTATVLFFVVALHSTGPKPLFPSAPAAPGVAAEHPTTADAAEHWAAADSTASSPGGGGNHAVAE